MNHTAKKKSNNGRTASKEVRRQQLIDATIESIATRGFSGTTIASVSRGAKLSQGIVNLHFTNKETLFVETLGYLAQEHFEYWSSAVEKAGDNTGKQLAAMIETDFAPSICTPKKVAVWFAFWGQAKQRPSYLKVHDRFDNQRDKEIKRLCAQIVEEGRYEDIDAASMARSLVALVDGLWLNFLLYPKLVSRKQARGDCFTFLADAFPDHFPAP
jgi:TetR/AcrR family transcriptional regulator, transcriptional repressor of bet genes